jgi:hypothetical protein
MFKHIKFFAYYLTVKNYYTNKSFICFNHFNSNKTTYQSHPPVMPIHISQINSIYHLSQSKIQRNPNWSISSMHIKKLLISFVHQHTVLRTRSSMKPHQTKQNQTLHQGQQQIPRLLKRSEIVQRTLKQALEACLRRARWVWERQVVF